MTKRTFTREEQILLTNIERARSAGVEVGGECDALYDVMIGVSATTGNTPVTDERISNANDHLFDRAAHQGKQNDVKWIGQVK